LLGLLFRFLPTSLPSLMFRGPFFVRFKALPAFLPPITVGSALPLSLPVFLSLTAVPMTLLSRWVFFPSLLSPPFFCQRMKCFRNSVGFFRLFLRFSGSQGTIEKFYTSFFYPPEGPPFYPRPSFFIPFRLSEINSKVFLLNSLASLGISNPQSAFVVALKILFLRRS